MWRAGYRFVTQSRSLPGTPDLSNTRRKWAIFVHGCFWHGHKGCAKARLPKTNTEFWADKIAGNAERDRRNEQALADMGFEVYVIYECSLSELARTSDQDSLSFRLPRHPHRGR